MHFVMNMSSYEIESNSARKENTDSMRSVSWSPVNVHLSLAEYSSSTNKLTTLPRDLSVAASRFILAKNVQPYEAD